MSECSVVLNSYDATLELVRDHPNGHTYRPPLGVDFLLGMLCSRHLGTCRRYKSDNRNLPQGTFNNLSKRVLFDIDQIHFAKKKRTSLSE